MILATNSKGGNSGRLNLCMNGDRQTFSIRNIRQTFSIRNIIFEVLER